VPSPSSTDQTSKSTFPYGVQGFAQAMNKHVMPKALADGFGSYMADGGAAESQRAELLAWGIKSAEHTRRL